MRTKFILLCSIIAIASSSAHGKIVGIFDVDGTLNRDKGPGAAWITPWLLKRVERLHSVAQQSPNGSVQVELSEPAQIEYYNNRYNTTHPTDLPVIVPISLPDILPISFDEFSQIEASIAKDEGVLGSLRPTLLKFDPVYPQRQLLVIPGYYRIFDLTFKYYREAANRSNNYLLRDLRNARKRVTLLGEAAVWKGPAFALFQAMMDSQDTVLNVNRFTSRGQSESDFWEADEDMVLNGEIKHSKGRDGRRPKNYLLSRPESRLFGKNLATEKLEVIKEILRSLYHSAGEKHFERIDNKDRMRMIHTLIVAEDEPAYVEPIAEYFLNMSSGYYADQVKLVILHTGSDEQVKNASFPYRWTVFMPGHRARPATRDEIEFWHRTRASNCEQELKPSHAETSL